MPVIDWILNALGIIENLFSAAIVAILTYMIFGGWKFVFRAVSFFFDTQLVKLIGTVFSYFNQLLTMEMFSEELMDELLGNVYVFIGVIMFFRLMMLVIKYLINPDMISDAKAGVTSLIQRVVIGCCGILFIPTIFDLANQLQVAILEDGIIQQLIIPHDMIEQMEDKINQGGHYIGTYVLAGFLSPNSSASSADVKQFDLGVQQGDLSNIDVNEGGFLTQKFKYDYFFFISTLALGYVFYYMLKYCIDIAGRCFKLLLYKLLAPIAMIEYMINGSQDGVFKQWLSATISTYAMLFVRILAIWFVLLVTTLMGDEGGAYAGELLTNNDYFLRAIIIIALLGFMMDLPKLVGQVFGLDLEQEGSASGVLKQVGGMVKGAAIGALAVGGAAAGSLAGDLGGLASARRQANAQTKAEGFTKKNGYTASEIADKRRENLKKNLADMDKGQMFRNSGTGILTAAMGANQFTNAFAGSFSNNKKTNESVGESMYAKEVSKNKQKQQEAERHDEITGNQKSQQALQLAAVLDQSGIKVDEQTMAVRMHPEMCSAGAGSAAANVSGTITAAAATLTAKDFDSSGNLTDEAKTRVTHQVEQVLTTSCDNSDVRVEPKQIQVQAQAIMDSVSFTPPSGSMKATATVSVDTVLGATTTLAQQDQVITQTVNQVAGIRMNGAVEDATQVINQQLGRIVDNTGTTATAVTQQVDIQRNISDSVSQSVDIQRTISDNVERSVEVQEDIQYDVHAQTNIQRNQVRMVDDIRENTIPTRSDREIPRGDD